MAINSIRNLEILRNAFSEGLGLGKSQIVHDLAYNSIREWDSLGHMALVAAIEFAFDIMMDTDDIIDMSSFAKAKEIIQKYGIDINA